MAACDDLIFFDNSGDWVLIANETRTANLTPRGQTIPMTPIDLGVSIKSDYVAALASTTEPKDTWRSGGELRQVYDFRSGSRVMPNNKQEKN